jgi:FecR-like protein
MSVLTRFRNGLLTLAIMFAAVQLASSPALAQTKIASTGDKVTTGGNGKQILFRDNTSVKAGTDTSVTVRRANYDTGSGKENIVIEVTKGAFRYVTGDTAGSHTVKTPQATVGVRGTVIEGFVDSRGYEIFALMEGALDVCTPLGCRSLNTPGTFVVVSPAGVIGEPMAIPPQMMDSLLLPTPSLNLVLEYFFTVVASGQDPLPRFRGLDEIQNGKFTSPVAAASATCPPKGPWGGAPSFKGFGYASKGFHSKYACPPKHHHHKPHHYGGDTE